MNGVVPAWRLRELLELPKLKQIREAEEDIVTERIRKSTPGAKLDSAVAKRENVPISEDNPNHLEDFTRLVDVAARKKSDR